MRKILLIALIVLFFVGQVFSLYKPDILIGADDDLIELHNCKIINYV